MSATGFTILPDRIHLISDGKVVKHDRSTVYATDSRKAFKVSDHCGVLWMGQASHAFQNLVEIMEIKNKKYPKGVADVIGNQVRLAFEEKPDIIDVNSQMCQYWIVILGYNAFGKLALWQVMNTDDTPPFEPTAGEVGVGAIGSMINSFDGVNASPFDKLVVQNKHLGPEKAMRKAFDKCITLANQRNGNCGGEIFFETIYK